MIASAKTTYISSQVYLFRLEDDLLGVIYSLVDLSLITLLENNNHFNPQCLSDFQALPDEKPSSDGV